jgi:hypothetical protein
LKVDHVHEHLDDRWFRVEGPDSRDEIAAERVLQIEDLLGATGGEAGAFPIEGSTVAYPTASRRSLRLSVVAERNRAMPALTPLLGISNVYWMSPALPVPPLVPAGYAPRLNPPTRLFIANVELGP